MADELPDDCTICFCHCVLKGTILEAIRNGANTHALVQDATRASTGCGGCEAEVLELLKAELDRKQKAG